MTPLPVCQKHVTQTHAQTAGFGLRLTYAHARTQRWTTSQVEFIELFRASINLNHSKHIQSQKAGESRGATTGDVVFTRSAPSELLLCVCVRGHLEGTNHICASHFVSTSSSVLCVDVFVS